MFDVALSRRMCCSRVDRVSTKPRRPLGVHGLAAQAPRHLADEGLAAGEQADVGPAEVEAVADRLALGHGDVGPHLARGTSAGRSDTASVVTTISRAPAAWAASAMAVTSVTVPKTLGVWTTTQAVSASMASITARSASTAAARRRVSTPAEWARVWAGWA